MRLAKILLASVLIIASSDAPTKRLLYRRSTAARNASQAFEGPIRVHPNNPLYFTDDSGKAIYFSGHQLIWDLQDHAFGHRETLRRSTNLDWSWYLEFATERNLNLIRNWSVFSFGKGKEAADPGPYTQPLAYERISGFGNALDGRPKFDLNTFHQPYFDRLRSRIQEASARGICVVVMLFDVYNFMKNVDSPPNTLWDGNVFNGANNIHGLNADTDRDGNGVEFFSREADSAFHYFQKAYIRKVIDTVNDLDNVIYEIANELYSPLWQADIIDFVKTYQAGKPRQHLILRSPGVVLPVGGLAGLPHGGFAERAELKEDLLFSLADIFSIDFRWAGYEQPNVIANMDSNPVIWDDDHGPKPPDHRKPWWAFTRGYHYILYDKPFEFPELEEQNEEWDRVRFNIGQVVRYANQLNLATMRPHATLSTSQYCLADPGHEYIAFHPLASDRLTVYGLFPGVEYVYEWYIPQLNQTLAAQTFIAEGSSRTFTNTPDAGSVVLYLRLAEALQGDTALEHRRRSRSMIQEKSNSSMKP